MKKTTNPTNPTDATDAAGATNAKMAERSAGSTAPRRKPKQPRSIATFNAILEAAATLFATQGYEPTTTHQMAKAAGVSVGALYRYFDGKEAILREVYREETQSLRHRILASFTIAELVGQDLPALVHKAMTHAFQIYAERPGLRRVLVEQARKVPELAEIRKEQEREVHDAVRAIFNAAPGVQIPDIEIGAYLIVLFMEALIDDHTLYRTPTFDPTRVINGATDFILRYALGSAAPAKRDEPDT